MKKEVQYGIIGVAALATIGIGSYAVNNQQTQNQGQQSKSSSQNQQSKQQIVKKAIAGNGYLLEVKTIDGMSPDEAYQKESLPNIVHDSAQYYYFVDDKTVEVAPLAASSYRTTASYKVTDNEIIILDSTIGDTKLPYQVNGNKFSFSDLSDNADDHKMTYQIVKNAGAKENIESKPQMQS